MAVVGGASGKGCNPQTPAHLLGNPLSKAGQGAALPGTQMLCSLPHPSTHTCTHARTHSHTRGRMYTHMHTHAHIHTQLQVEDAF